MEFFLAYVELGKDRRAVNPNQMSLSACEQLYVI